MAGQFFKGIFVVCVVLVLGFPVWAGKVIDWNDRQIVWHSYDNGLNVAERTGRHVLLVIYTDWCPHCVELGRLFHDPAVVQASQQLVMVRFNSEAEPGLSAEYAPDGEYIPRVMVLRADGAILPGFTQSDDEYRYFMDSEEGPDLAGFMHRAAGAR